MKGSQTPLINGAGIYERYVRKLYNKDTSSYLSAGPLNLSHITRYFGLEKENDDKIILGEIKGKPVESSAREWPYHQMGLYRDNEAYIKRVDEVTALLAKKCIATPDNDVAMSHAWGFGILRGYNLRSITGACWAQEMSLRLLFAVKNWPQFCKAPGVFLDVEACLLNPGDPYKSFADFIQKLSNNYVAARAELEVVDPLFDAASPATKEEFARHLIISDNYEVKQLPKIFSVENPERLIDLAARGYKDKFFEKLNSAVDRGHIRLEEIKALNIDWSKGCFSNPEMFNADIFRDRVCVAATNIAGGAGSLAESAASRSVGGSASSVVPDSPSGVVCGGSKTSLGNPKSPEKLFQYHYPRQ
jgi:hypothetical protein